MSERFVTRRRLGEPVFARLLLAPATVLMIAFLAIPLLYAIALSFQHYDLRVQPRGGWIGLRNFEALLEDSVFWQSAAITLRFCAMFVAFGATMSLVFALALNRRFRGAGFVRIAMLLPWAVAPLIAGLMWRFLFHGSYGLVNAGLTELGLISQYVQWFSNPDTALLVAALGTTWMWMPFITLVLLAALQAIPDQLYGAARMDGANVWVRFTNVTFPAIRGVFIVTLLILVVVGLETFDLLYSMTGGGPGYATSVLNYLTYVEGFERLNLGRSAALGMIITILVMLVGGATILLVWLQGKRQARSGFRKL